MPLTLKLPGSPLINPPASLGYTTKPYGSATDANGVIHAMNLLAPRQRCGLRHLLPLLAAGCPQVDGKPQHRSKMDVPLAEK
jgi:hypothetical protein